MKTIIPKIGAASAPKKVASKRYTPEETEELVHLYVEDPTSENVDYLSQKFGRSVKSIISKLAREKVYIAKPYKPKYGDKPATKEAIVKNIATALNVDFCNISGIVKSQKSALIELESALQRLDLLDETSI